MPKIQEPRHGQLTVTIPQEMARAMKWKKGTQVVFSYEGNHLTVKEVKSEAKQ